jgi:hypothetical protein
MRPFDSNQVQAVYFLVESIEALRGRQGRPVAGELYKSVLVATEEVKQRLNISVGKTLSIQPKHSEFPQR